MSNLDVIRSRWEKALRWEEFDGLNEDTIQAYAYTREDVMFLLAEVERLHEAAKGAAVIVSTMQAENAELHRERDAAIYDLCEIGHCDVCAFGPDIDKCGKEPKAGCFEWRGPRGEREP